LCAVIYPFRISFRFICCFGSFPNPNKGLPPPEAVMMLEDKVTKDSELQDVNVVWTGEGEWHITVQVFRDLGSAFAVAVLGIYILLLYQTQSYLLPAIQLIALPLSVIGIIPGFWLLNLLTGHPVDGWNNPIYFTATAMIGMIALSGIATRNAILLIEFVEKRRKEGETLVESLLEAGALRTRPIVLTSLGAMLAAWPITLDPIFSGLAWALIFVKGADDGVRHPKTSALISDAAGSLIRRRINSSEELIAAVYASLVRIIEERELIRFGPFDATFCRNASPGDLDEDKITRFLVLSRRGRNFPLPGDTPPHEVLVHLNLLDKGRPTNVGV